MHSGIPLVSRRSPRDYVEISFRFIYASHVLSPLELLLPNSLATLSLDDARGTRVEIYRRGELKFREMYL